MELDKFHVGQLRTRKIRHRHPVAGRDSRVCRVKIQLAGPTGTKDDRPGKDLAPPAQDRIEILHAHAPAVIYYQTYGRREGQEADVRFNRCPRHQRPDKFTSGRIAVSMQEYGAVNVRLHA